MDDWKTRITKVHPPPPRGDTALAGPACLVLIYPTGTDLGKRYELAQPVITIGRVNDCDIQVDRDSVSRKHARIERKDAGWAVVDMGSTNGTFVNDKPVRDQVLRDGDFIKIGNAIFKFLTGNNIETAYHEEIYRMAIVDGLTQAYNKRYLIEYLERELARCGRNKRPLSLVMFDIDHFKRINDDHGHLTGDHVLKELAARVRQRVRREEVFARYGGEEFAVVLPEASTENAARFAEEVRVLVERDPFEFEGERLLVTISLGVSTVSEEMPVEAFIKRVDEKLYAAKRAGRNRVAS